jgi:hypothetical protein
MTFIERAVRAVRIVVAMTSAALVCVACDSAASIASDLSGVAASDPCQVTVGSNVVAPWSRTQKKFPGTVTEVYGKLARVDFDCGFRVKWTLVSRRRDHPGRSRFAVM